MSNFIDKKEKKLCGGNKMENNKEYKEHYAQVKDWGDNLQYVPKKLITKELCEVAVSNYGYALQYVPEELKTPELCELAVTSNGGWALQFVPEELKTFELCEYAVSRDGYNLDFVPDELRTFEICELAVQNEFKGRVDKVLNAFVPEEFHKELSEKYDIELPEKSKGR